MSDNQDIGVNVYTPDFGWCHGIDPGIVQIYGRMPQAHLKEGSIMRVDSIVAVNAHQQHNRHTPQTTVTSTGNTVFGTSFEEYLRANLQQQNTPVVTRQTDNQIAGLLLGYFTPLRVSQKAEAKPESSAS